MGQAGSLPGALFLMGLYVLPDFGQVPTDVSKTYPAAPLDVEVNG